MTENTNKFFSSTEFTPPEPPPPYHDASTWNALRSSVESPITTAVLPGYSAVANTGPSESLETLLANQGLLTFRTVPSPRGDNDVIIVQICDSQGEIMMSGMWTMTHSGGEYSERLLTFTDVNGKFLLTCKESGNTVIVNNGDRLFGVIRGTRELCPSSLVAENTLGEELFRTVREESKFSFESKDSVLATACTTETSEGATSWVEFSPSLDVNTKTMITVVTYYLNVIFATETCCCCSGATSPTTLSYLAPLIMFFLFVVFVKVIFKLIQRYFSST